MTGEYKKILFELLDVIGLDEADKVRASDVFKQKLAFELLKSIQAELSEEDRKWLAQELSKSPNPGNPKIAEVKIKIGELFSESDLHNRSKLVFKKVLFDYIGFMSVNLDNGRVEKMKEIVNKI